MIAAFYRLQKIAHDNAPTGQSYDSPRQRLGFQKPPPRGSSNGAALFVVSLSPYSFARAFLLHPQIGVEVSVADCFGEMLFFDLVAGGDVGDGPGNSQDFVVGAGREAERLHAHA
ncbi:hypothetical protein CA85_31700 [Allorhodopirellula solitaria]|uniref:Uncharacterized protein n=1 Tax=Allorhodopirellula solitaria TaxID=2527987 RepID=A0A5C5XRH8_9BACT|nr:hypothetical protein CA85_31700 [Allorhodopirellula solitaria]